MCLQRGEARCFFNVLYNREGQVVARVEGVFTLRGCQAVARVGVACGGLSAKCTCGEKPVSEMCNVISRTKT
jgi:hypothetical protein